MPGPGDYTLLREFLAVADVGEPVALATVIATRRSVPRHAGSRMLVRADGSTSGSVGGGEMESRVTAEALQALQDGRPRLLHYELIDPGQGDPGMCGGEMTVYVEPHVPDPTVLVVGCGHVGREVVALAHWLGMRVVATDDRAEMVTRELLPDADVLVPGTIQDALAAVDPRQAHAVVVTRSIDLDLHVLPPLLASGMRSVGVIGSRRRWHATRKELLAHGVPAADLDQVRTPIGLRLGAETPREIAMSILAEIIAVRRGGDLAERSAPARKRTESRHAAAQHEAAQQQAGQPVPAPAGPAGYADTLVVLRGGGDLATGVAWRLTRAGIPVVVCELAQPLTVRRSVALSTAVTDGLVEIEGMVGVRATAAEAVSLTRQGVVPVLVSPELPSFPFQVVVDARMAKRTLDTSADDAPLVVALGPGYTAGRDCHAVVETMRGSRLGRVLWSGSAAADTGTPGEVAGRGSERVLRAPAEGVVRWSAHIGDVVEAGQVLGTVAGYQVLSPFAGLVRGLIADGTVVPARLKIGDVDPRADTDWRQISDKALAIGGGVLEAVLSWRREQPANGERLTTVAGATQQVREEY